MQQQLISKTRPKGSGSHKPLPLIEQHSNPRRPHTGGFGLVEEAAAPSVSAPHGMVAGVAPIHTAASQAYMNMARSHGPVNTMPMHSCPYCGQHMP